jgi:hypothetical protein
MQEIFDTYQDPNARAMAFRSLRRRNGTAIGIDRGGEFQLSKSAGFPDETLRAPGGLLVTRRLDRRRLHGSNLRRTPPYLASKCSFHGAKGILRQL